MNRIRIAVCDREEAYAKKLGDWFSIESGGQFQGYSFSEMEIFQEMYGSDSFDIVLVGEGFQKESWIWEEISRSLGHGTVLWMYLGEGRQGRKWLPAGEGGQELEELPVLKKYQPVPDMAREIFHYYQKFQKSSGEALVCSCEKEVIAWYAPAKSSLQTPLAMTMASVLGEREKVLYVNFGECSGFSQWFFQDYQRDLLDVMYLCLNEKSGFLSRLKSAVHTMEGFDYIPPAMEGQLLGETGKEAYLEFLKRLMERSDYNVIILDFESMIPGFFEMLEWCGRIYVLTEQMILKEGAAKHFREQVDCRKNPGLREKIIWTDTPFINTSMLTPGCLMQQWIFGEVGDCVREMLEGNVGRA